MTPDAAPFDQLDDHERLETGRLFSIHRELQIGLYGSVTAIVVGVGLLFDAPTRWTGAALLTVLALYVDVRVFRQGRETFVLYAVGYATLGLTSCEVGERDAALDLAQLGSIAVTTPTAGAGGASGRY